MRSLRLLIALTGLLFLSIAARPALAARGSLALRCTGDPGGNATAPILAPAEHETVISTELYDPTIGKSADGESFQCTFIVPVDYDESGSPPILNFYGWAPGGQVAGLAGCTQPNEVQWDINWRSYIDAQSTGSSETQTESTDTEVLSCVWDFGSSRYIFTPEVFHDFSGEIVADTDDWSAGELIVLRPQRQTGGSNYELGFYVWLSAMEIDYPSTH